MVRIDCRVFVKHMLKHKTATQIFQRFNLRLDDAAYDLKVSTENDYSYTTKKMD